MFIDPTGGKPSRETNFASALWELDRNWKHQGGQKPNSRRSRFKLFVLFLVAATLLYALSMGPVDAVMKSLPMRSPASRFAADVCRKIYYPMFLLHDRTPLASPIDAYLNLWTVK